MRAVELPEPTHKELETATFYEDDIVHGLDTT
jgi:hypothetical protein